MRIAETKLPEQTRAISSVRLVGRSLRYFWRIHLAVGLGVVVATAVFVGALVLGDSLRESLRALALRRLGPFRGAVNSARLFPRATVDRLASDPQFSRYFVKAAPVGVFRASMRVENGRQSEQGPIQLNGVQLIACDERFWHLASVRPRKLPGPREVILSEALAERLARVDPTGRAPRIGDRLLVRLALAGPIPTESVLGDKKNLVGLLSLEVIEILPDREQVQFSLAASQQQVLNAFIAHEALERLDVEKTCNLILVAPRKLEAAEDPPAARILEDLLRGFATEFGLRIEQTSRGYFNLTCEMMLFPKPLEEEILTALSGLKVQPVLTYLANRLVAVSLGEPADNPSKSRDGATQALSVDGRFIPYSMISALELTDWSKEAPLGPLLTVEGKPLPSIPDGSLVLNDWAAADLQVGPGDWVEMEYFDPESPTTPLTEKRVHLPVAAVVRLTEAAADPLWTPQVPGVTEKGSIQDWEAPFEPFHPEWVRMGPEPGPGNDEDYWDRFGTTPKGFVSLKTGRSLWGSRFGQTTSFRILPETGLSVETLRERLRINPASLGLQVLDLQQEALLAAEGTTAFAGLFLGFSFFVIVSAVILIVLTIRLGIDHRAGEMGLLLALGFPRKLVFQLILLEGGLVGLVAAACGVPVGILYAQGLIWGLHTLWLPAIGRAFVELSLRWESCLVGYLAGWGVSLLAVFWAYGGARRLAPIELVQGRLELSRLERVSRVSRWLAGVCLLGAVSLGLWAGSANLGLEQRALAFFGAGAMVLTAFMLELGRRLRLAGTIQPTAPPSPDFWRLAWMNLTRNPQRTTATAAVLASAVFVIAAVSVFRVEPAQWEPGSHLGSGGFALYGEVDLPILADLSTSEGRRQAGLKESELEKLASLDLVALRATEGDDASCTNLYKTRRPRLVGVPMRLRQEGVFRLRPWVSCAAEERANPWLLMDRQPASADPVPVVPAIVDYATATYALHLTPGKRQHLEIQDAWGNPLRLYVVAVLEGSIFQGDVLIREEDLIRCFPETTGYRILLGRFVPTAGGTTAAGGLPMVQRTLQQALADYGLTLESTSERLARFAAVQNTYLSTFQMLGGLGLLMGTAGLAAVQLRNVYERRRELAILRALGFSKSFLGRLLFLENVVVLSLGFLAALGASAVAVGPNLTTESVGLPWRQLAAIFGCILLAGIVAGVVAVQRMLRLELLRALRRE